MITIPYLSEKIKIENTKYDRRLKLTEEQREEIILLHEQGMSQRKLAIKFNVDRKTIYNTLNNDKYLEQLERRKKEQAHLKYYDKEQNTITKREHRRYKQKLYLKGKIK